MKTGFFPKAFFMVSLLSAVFFMPAAFGPNIFAQERTEQQRVDINELRRDIVRFGTETEIAALMQELREEGTDSLDNEIIALTRHTNNHNILGRGL